MVWGIFLGVEVGNLCWGWILWGIILGLSFLEGQRMCVMNKGVDFFPEFWIQNFRETLQKVFDPWMALEVPGGESKVQHLVVSELWGRNADHHWAPPRTGFAQFEVPLHCTDLWSGLLCMEGRHGGVWDLFILGPKPKVIWERRNRCNSLKRGLKIWPEGGTSVNMPRGWSWLDQRPNWEKIRLWAKLGWSLGGGMLRDSFPE